MQRSAQRLQHLYRLEVPFTPLEPASSEFMHLGLIWPFPAHEMRPGLPPAPMTYRDGRHVPAEFAVRFGRAAVRSL